MTKKILFSLLILIISTSTYGKSNRLKYDTLRRKQHVFFSPIIQCYSDSLRSSYRQFFGDSLQKDRNMAETDTYFSMMVPLTFYHSVARRLFHPLSENSTQDKVDRMLTNMYLAHPEWVTDTESSLSAEGNIAYRPEAPIVNNVGMTSQAEEEKEKIVIPSSSKPYSDVTLVTVKPNFWQFSGDYSLQFLQNYVSDNWYKGGESTYAMIGSLTVNTNYNDKEKIKWDNRLEMKLGMQSSQGDTIRNYKSSEDLIRLTSKLGVQSIRRWYYTLQAIASTQFTHGYKANDAKVYSDFMSPLNVNLSLGMDYKVEWFKKHLVGTVNISPIAANFKYVDRLSLATKYGIDEGKHSLWDLGSTLTTDLTCKFSDLVKWQTRLYAYTTYHRAEVEWENTITFQLSKYISTKLFVYPRFDDSTTKKDDKYGYFQLKEYWSLGFNYSF